LLDILECFSSFIKDGAIKDVKNMQQFYDVGRVNNIVGSDAWVGYNAKDILNMDFDLSIVESTNTPAYRQLANDILMQLWQARAISVEQLLEHGDYPFADKLLQSIRSQREQLAQGQTPDAVSPELLQQAQQTANMQNTQQAQQMLQA
jgi:hypothetical protein